MKSFPPDVAALFFMLVNDIVTETCVEHRVIDWRKTFLESPLKAQTAANLQYLVLYDVYVPVLVPQ